MTKIHKHTNRNRDVPDSIGVPEHNLMLVPISQLSSQSHKQFKTHKHMKMNRDTPDLMGVPEQPSHAHSDKPTLAQIAQALPEI